MAPSVGAKMGPLVVLLKSGGSPVVVVMQKSLSGSSVLLAPFNLSGLQLAFSMPSYQLSSSLSSPLCGSAFYCLNHTIKNW